MQRPKGEDAMLVGSITVATQGRCKALLAGTLKANGAELLPLEPERRAFLSPAGSIE